jgi:hypothetical protein
MPDEAPVSDPAAVEYRKRIQDAIERMEIEYDKALLALNPAAITVSIALYNQLIAAAKVPPGHSVAPCCVVLLATSHDIHLILISFE